MKWPVGGYFVAENPALPVTEARPFWRADWDVSVVAVDAIPTTLDDTDAFDIGQFMDVVTFLRHEDGHESMLFSDGIHHLQFEVVSGTVISGLVKLYYRMSGFRLVEPQTMSVRRLAQFCRLGRFPLTLFPPEPRAHRWVMALQAHDGTMVGASHREIAAALFGEQAVRDDWSGRSDFLRLRVQRLVHMGSAMVRGGYRDLLRGAGTNDRQQAVPKERKRGTVYR